MGFVDKMLGIGSVDVDIADKDGTSPILMASFQSDMPLLKILHKYQANINIMNKEGQTPLIYQIN